MNAPANIARSNSDQPIAGVRCGGVASDAGPPVQSSRTLAHAANGGTAQSAGHIRTCDERDIPRVCEIFSNSFRAGKVKDHARLAACIRDTYFGAPAFRPERASIVHVNDEGVVDGFLGIIPISYKVGEQLISAGILSAYMSDDPNESPKTGVALARAVVSLPFDLLFTDTANNSGFAISRAMRFTPLPQLSLEWFKILQPLGTGLYFLNKRLPRLARMLRPMAASLDGCVHYLFPQRRAAVKKSVPVETRPVGMPDFVRDASRFLPPYNVRPVWDPVELEWFTKQAAHQTKNGLLQAYDVRGRGGKPAGLFLLYVSKGGVANALQVLARPGCEDIVMRSMIEVAEASGAVAIRGATTREAMAGLLSCSGVFYHHVMTTVAWSRHPDVARSIASGDLFIGGLAGETWARIVAEEF